MDTFIYLYDLYYRLLNNIFKWEILFYWVSNFYYYGSKCPPPQVKMLFNALTYIYIYIYIYISTI